MVRKNRIGYLTGRFLILFVKEVGMMTSRCKSMLFAVSLLFLAGAISSPWAHAGQRSIFNGIPTEADCRICHNDQDFNEDRHHYLIGTVIPELDESLAPDAPAVPGEDYGCLSCHEIENGVFKEFRDCMVCHPVWIVTGPPGRGDNVHHNITSVSCIDCHSD